MQQVSDTMGHAAAARAHVETAVYHAMWALARPAGDPTGEVAYHASMARANMVFAAHHAIEAEMTSPTAPGDLGPAPRSRGGRMPHHPGPVEALDELAGTRIPPLGS